jgi:hypothetical protein
MAGCRQEQSPARVFAPQRGALMKSPGGLPFLSRPRLGRASDKAAGCGDSVSWIMGCLRALNKT